MRDYNLTFYIHNGSYVYANFLAPDGRLRISTGVTLSDTETLGNLPKHKKNRLATLTMLVDEYVGNCNLSRLDPKKDEVAEIIKSEQGIKTEVVTVRLIVERYREKAGKGQAYTKGGHVVSGNTIKTYDNVLNALDKKLGNIPIGKVTERDFLLWRQRLAAQVKKYKNGTVKQMSQNTITTYNNVLLSIITATRKLGWHNVRITGGTSTWEVIDYAIYYSIEELQLLYRHEFTGEQEKIRDVFVFGCFTCLRHSDYYATDYKSAVKGDVIKVKLQKKKNMVEIPLHPIAKSILEKYNYSLPRVIIQHFNTEIKEVCKKAGFIEKVLFTRTHGGQLVREYKEKWQLTTSHTMRRSFATNALKSGMKEWVVMAIGGWKSEASFKKYKRMSEQDVKDNALSSDFYKVKL